MGYDEEPQEKDIVDKALEAVANEAGKQVKKGLRSVGKIIFNLIKPALPWIALGIGILLAAVILTIGLDMLISELTMDTVDSIIETTNPNAENSDGSETESKNQALVEIDEDGAYKIREKDIGKKVREKLEKQKVDNELLGFEETIQAINESGETTEELIDMIDKYIEASLQTMYPKTEAFGNDFDGIITIKRLSANTGEEVPLKYKKYKDFCADVQAEKEEILEFFSINPDDFNLCIARRGNGTAYYDYNGNPIPGDSYGNERKIVKEEINYKKYVQNYMTPINFFVSLHVVSQDKDFMEDIVDMVVGKNKIEPIVLTYIDIFDESSTTYNYEGSVLKSSVVMPEEKLLAEEPHPQIEYGVLPEVGMETITINNQNVKIYYTPKEYHKKVSLRYSGNLYITKADTWLKTANKEITKIPTGLVKDNREQVVNENKKTYKIYTDESTQEKNGVKIHEKIIIQEVATKQASSARYIVSDIDSEIKVDDMVNKIREYIKVEDNLTSAPSHLFDLLQQDPEVQTLERIMRYVLYKLSDIDYGILEEDLKELLADNYFSEGDSVGNLRKYLIQFSGEAPKSEDGKYYKMYGDGVGWPTIGNADLQWKSNYPSFQVKGKILHKGEELEVENIAEYINTNCLTKTDSDPNNSGPNAKYSDEEVEAMEIYIEKELVDKIGDDKQIATYNAIVENDLRGIELARQQIYPLVAIRYNFGHLPERDGKTFRVVYLEGINEQGYEEGSWQHNRYIWDNWWCKLGGGATGHIPSRDAAYETYVKGVFDFKTSSVGGVFTRNYLFYTSEQLDAFDYAPRERNGNFKVLRTPENEEETFTMVFMKGEFIPSDERYINGYYISTNGRKFTILNQGLIGWSPKPYWNHLGTGKDGDKDNGWHYKCNRAACAIIASGYSEETPEELITTMNQMYDEYVPSDRYWSLYGLTRTEYKYGHVSAEDFTEIIRKQLRKGGYIAVWVNSNEAGYTGKSGKCWTGDIHWMAIIDYKVENGREKICIADASMDSNDDLWYDIDEYCHGIDNYALIDEK